MTIQGLHGSGTFAGSISLTNSEVSSTSCCIVANSGSIVMRADNMALNQSTLNASAGDGPAGPITLVSRGSLDIRNSRLLTTAFLALGGPVDLTAGRNIDLIGTVINTTAINGGPISITAPTISLSNSTLTTRGAYPEFENRGTISLTATKAVNLSNGTVLSVFGGFDQAAFIRINGGALFTSRQSTISGSTIQINASTVKLTETQVTASTSVGLAGTITLDAKNTTLTNSQILTPAIEGTGGTININSPRFHQDASSAINATNGTVTINGVIQP